MGGYKQTLGRIKVKSWEQEVGRDIFVMDQTEDGMEICPTSKGVEGETSRSFA